MSSEGIHPIHQNSEYAFCHKMQERWIDIALILGGIACLTIAVLATTGCFNAMGSVNATYLSYGLYGGAAIALIALVAKIAIGDCQPGNRDKILLDNSNRQQQNSASIKNQTINRQTVHPQILEILSPIKDVCNLEFHDHFCGVEALLTSCHYKSANEFYTFYYHLSSISEYILKEGSASLKEKWSHFISQIHGIELHGEENKHMIDCSIELKRLKGERIQLNLEKIEKTSPSYQADMEAITTILREAFEIFDEEYSHWVSEHNPCFVIRSDAPSGGQILGCISLRLRTDVVYVHNLARKASAVRLGITEQFSSGLRKIFESEGNKEITCNVSLDNKVAISIYQKLGFRSAKDAESRDSVTMVYNPEVPIG